MATSKMSEFIQQLRRVMVKRDEASLTDGQLLEDYISRCDEAALAALVVRHGPMVWGVCRRVLSNYHDAEDAFQATFLVLVRKAASIASRELLANWLYGVAHQTALKARATAAKRRARERQVTEMPEPATKNENLCRDLRDLLDEELSRLPDKYRAVIVLCDLEGKTRRQAARQLGCPEGTVAGRLARARIMLAKRLTQRGVALSGAASAAALAQQVVSAGVPPSMVDTTIKAASPFAAGKAVATGAISIKVATLTEGVLKAMSMTKLKLTFALMVFACVLGSTGGVVVWQAQAEAQQPAPIDQGFPIDDPMPDLTGTWQGGGGWGTVVLRRTNEGVFEGTYTDTFGTDVGRLSVRWYSASGRYEGTWNEGKYRFGRIALEPSKDGEAASGAWTTDPKCEHKPGVPSLASLRWEKSKPKSGDAIGTKPQSRAEQSNGTDKDKQPTAAKKAEKYKLEKERLQGTWKIVSHVYDGEKDESAISNEWTFKDRTLKVHIPAKKDHGEITAYFRFRLDETTNPKRIDMVEGKVDDLFDTLAFDKRLDDMDKRIEGIYSIAGDTLTLCLSRKMAGERPTAFGSKAGSKKILTVLRKVSQQNIQKESR